jgi:hypothetical protein
VVVYWTVRVITEVLTHRAQVRAIALATTEVHTVLVINFKQRIAGAILQSALIRKKSWILNYQNI